MKYKYIKSGEIIEIYEYEKDIKNKGNPTGRRGADEDEEEGVQLLLKIKKNREAALSRAQKNLRRIINSNVREWGDMAKFLTLTFKENITDIKLANYEFKKFIQRLGYELGLKVQYSAVIEFQKRGAIHYHVILYNVSYMPSKALEKIWGLGFVKVNKIQQVDNVGAYVTKYMTKDNEDTRLQGQKSYFNSRGLHKPEIINDLDAKKIGSLRESLEPFTKYTNSFENEHTGKIEYTQYNLRSKD